MTASSLTAVGITKPPLPKLNAMSEIPEQYRNLLAAESRTAPERTSPRLLLVYGPVKHSKTETIARLRGCRVVDMDAAGGGTKFVAEASYEPFRPKTLKEF